MNYKYFDCFYFLQSIIKSSGLNKILFLIALFFLFVCEESNATITVNSIAVTESTCENNGTATITASSTPNPFLLYKIVAGPVTSPLQNSPTFNSLYPGNYTAHIYDINFDSIEVQFTIAGNYTLPDFTPYGINPTCAGFTDGTIEGNADSARGTLPFAWQITSPINIGPQPTDLFTGLPSGTYTMTMTDSCGNIQTRTVILPNTGTGLAPLDGMYTIPYVQKYGCDSFSYHISFRIFKEKAHTPLTITITTDFGTSIQHIIPTPVDTTNYIPGWYSIAGLIPDPITYGSNLSFQITDTCGVSIYSSVNMVAPFWFTHTFINVAADCQSQYGAYFSLPYWPNYGYDGTSAMAPLHYELTVVSTGAMADSGTVTMSPSGFTVQAVPAGVLYHLHVTDGCGDVYDEDILWPTADIPQSGTYYQFGCLDSTAAVTIYGNNFNSLVTIEITSGPTSVHSTKPGYAYYDTLIYPITFYNINPVAGGTFNNFPLGDYTYTIYDTCGNLLNGSFTVDPAAVSNFHYNYSVKHGCLGNNTLYFQASWSNYAVTYNITNVNTGALVLQRTNYISDLDSVTSIPPGDYAIEIFYSSALYYNGDITPNINDCWVLHDTITVTSGTNNYFQSNTNFSCNGITYVQVNVDSSNGVPPYLYEIISGPQTFPQQIENTFTLISYGNYSVRIVDACGNSFIQQISVDSATYVPVIKHGSFCAGNTIELLSIQSSYFSYYWQLPGGGIYNGDTLVIDPLTTADTGLYILGRIVNINGCIDTSYSNYSVTLTNQTVQDIIICNGDSVIVGIHHYYNTGIYYDTLSTASGCDSLIVLNLTVNLYKRDTINAQVCNGGNYLMGGNNYNTTGTFTDTLSTLTCDSIVLLNLTVSGFIRDTINAQVCTGGNYVMGGNTYSVTGIFTDTLSTTTCDSIVLLNLTVTDFIRDTVDAQICSGNNFTMGGNIYNTTGTFTDTLSTSTCDSIVLLNLTVTDFIRDTINTQLCSGSSFTMGGNIYNTTGTFTDTLSTTTCDSIVLLNLTIMDFIRDTINAQLCAGDNFTMGGNIYNTSGTFSDTLSTSTCDSIVLLNLTITDFARDTINEQICTGSSFTMGGNIYTTTGTFTDTLSTSTCDSIVLLHLTVTDFLHDTISAAVCTGYTYSFGGNNLSVAGSYTDTFSTVSCDSIVILYLSLTDFIRDTINETICAGDSYLLGSNLLSQSGTYTDTLATLSCDSIVMLNLIVAPFKRDTIGVTICAGDSFTTGNNTYSQAGIYTDTLSTSTCDSILTINIGMLPYGYDTLYPVICDNENYILGNNIYNTEGNYTDTVSGLGCDSIITIYLTVNDAPEINIIVSDTQVTTGTLVHLEASEYNLTYLWNANAYLNSYSIRNPTATIINSTWIYLTVENNAGCFAYDSVFIRADSVECNARNMYAPNAFSPNGDHINDKFFLIPHNVELIELQIYNRWGEKVFETNDIKKAWDGTFRKQIRPDVYVYWIKYFGCKEEFMKGTILLIQ